MAKTLLETGESTTRQAVTMAAAVVIAVMRRAIFALVVVSSAASVADAQTTLRYQFKEGDKLQYVIDQKMKMTMSVMGMDIETKMNMTLQLSWAVLGVDKEGNAKLQLKITHAKMAMEGVTGNVAVDSSSDKEPDDPVGKLMHQVAKATGAMEMTGTLLPTGEMRNAVVSEATLKAMKNLPGAGGGNMLSPESFKTMINNVVLPTESVTKGKTWTHKTEAKTPLGTTTTDNLFTYEGSTGKEGAKLEKISIKPTVSIEANPDAPAKIKIKSSKGSGTVLFDNKAGRVVEMTNQQTTEMALNANGLDVNQTIEQTTTMRLKKK